MEFNNKYWKWRKKISKSLIEEYKDNKEIDQNEEEER